MNMLLAANDSTTEGIAFALIIAIVIVSVLLAVAALVSLILRLKIFFNYWVANRSKSAAGYTGETAACEMLRLCGVPDVQVKKMGFFRALIYGNHYNATKKVIYLRRTTFRGNNLTAVALAVEKVALAREDHYGGGKLRARWRLQQLALFGPIVFIPIVLVGLIFDLLGGFTGIPLLISSIVGALFFLVSFILTAITVPVEKKATRDAMSLLASSNMLTPEEQQKAAKVLKVYVLSYIMDFIVALLKLIELILKLILSIFTVFASDKK